MPRAPAALAAGDRVPENISHGAAKQQEMKEMKQIITQKKNVKKNYSYSCSNDGSKEVFVKIKRYKGFQFGELHCFDV